MTHEELQQALAQTQRFAAEMLAETGEVMGMVAIHSKDGELAALPYTKQNPGVEQWALVETIKGIRRTGLFKYAVLISEAWQAKMPLGWKPGDPFTPASENPERLEVLVAYVVSEEGKAVAFWPIERDADGKFVKLGETEPCEGVQSWLDRAVEPLEAVS